MNLQLLPQALPPTSYRRSAVSRPKKPVDIKIRDSTFSDESPTWVPRPPPEDVHKLLEDFFAEHDLDKPVIEASSGGTSPTTTEPKALPLTPPGNIRARTKKSIRIVAKEHKKRIDRTSKADATSYTNDMLRRRNTKLWGSRMEIITSEFAKSTSSSSLPESSPGGPSE